MATGATLDVATLLERAQLPLPEAWRRAHWSEAELLAGMGDWDGDDDRDGWTNLVEFALGGKPRAPDPGPPVQLDREVIAPAPQTLGELRFSLSFNWSPLAEGVAARSFERLLANGTWADTQPASEVLVTDNPFSGLRRLTADFASPESPLIVRLRVEFAD